jgi:hypothetical protein
LRYKEEEKIRRESKREKATEMAKVMKKNGKSIEKIVAYTGLSKKEVEKL